MIGSHGGEGGKLFWVVVVTGKSHLMKKIVKKTKGKAHVNRVLNIAGCSIRRNVLEFSCQWLV